MEQDSHKERNIIDLGFMNGWRSDGIEYRLLEIVREAGYKFAMVSHNERGTNTIYQCDEAALRYHVDSSD